jgi:tetraacyldisaccharide 4'-kinase
MSEQTYFDLISGVRRGPLAAAARAALHVPAWFYGRIIGLRNRYYDRYSLPHWLDVPVISVGNLTVGGTGKTPMTVLLCERLLARGLKPAVLSRGYKAEPGSAPDELLLISRRVAKAVVIANPDRAASGELAIEEYDAKAAVLDDGFQHRRMGRDLDLVLIDATRPFGFGHMLPRGLLREPVTSLTRASAIVLTRTDARPAATLNEIEQTVRRYNAHAPILRSVHRPAGFTDLQGNPAEPPQSTRIGAFAAIARPDAFLRTLDTMNLAPAAERRWPDHHNYEEHDARELINWARADNLDVLITTEKDAVKLAGLHANWPIPVLALRVDLELVGDGNKILDELIDEMLRDHEEPHEPHCEHAEPE